MVLKFKTFKSRRMNFVSIATSFVSKMELTNNYPLPTSPGDITFYVITP